VERIVQLDSFGDLGRIVTVSPLLFIVLDELPLPALTLSLGGLCKACSRPLVSWSLARAYRWCCGRLRVHHSSLPVALDRGSFGRRTLAGRRLDPIPGRTPGGTAGG
jgi:hypothetical protein